MAAKLIHTDIQIDMTKVNRHLLWLGWMWLKIAMIGNLIFSKFFLLYFSYVWFKATHMWNFTYNYTYSVFHFVYWISIFLHFPKACHTTYKVEQASTKPPTISCLMSCIPFLQCDAQNTEHQLMVTAFNGLPHAIFI